MHPLRTKHYKARYQATKANGAVAGPVKPSMGFMRQLKSVGNSRLKVRWVPKTRRWQIWEQIPNCPAELIMISPLQRLDNRVIGALRERCMLQWASKQQAYESFTQANRDEESEEVNQAEEMVKFGSDLCEDWERRSGWKTTTTALEKRVREDRYAGLNKKQRKELSRLERKFR